MKIFGVIASAVLKEGISGKTYLNFENFYITILFIFFFPLACNPRIIERPFLIRILFLSFSPRKLYRQTYFWRTQNHLHFTSREKHNQVQKV